MSPTSARESLKLLLEREDHEEMREVPVAARERDARADLEARVLGAHRCDGAGRKLVEAQPILRRERVRQPKRVDRVDERGQSVAIESVVVVAIRRDGVLRAKGWRQVDVTVRRRVLELQMLVEVDLLQTFPDQFGSSSEQMPAVVATYRAAQQRIQIPKRLLILSVQVHVMPELHRPGKVARHGRRARQAIGAEVPVAGLLRAHEGC